MESAVNLNWAYSTRRQTAYATALSNSFIDQTHPFINPDFGQHNAEFADNAAHYGKGHEFATRNEILTWDTMFSRTFDATTKILGWAWAFHLGSVTTSNLGGSPTAYRHTMEYQDPLGAGYYGSGRQQAATAVIEQVTAGLVRKFPSLCVKSVEVSGQQNQWLQMSVELQGSGEMSRITPVSSYTFPTSQGAEGALLRNASLSFSHGVSGSLADVSCDVRSWRVRSEMQYFDVEGYCPGSGYLGGSTNPAVGQVRNKLEFARRAFIFEFTVRADASTLTWFTRLEGSTELFTQLTVDGTTISGANPNRFRVTIPRHKFRAVPVGNDGDLIIYNISGVVFYDTVLANPFEVIVQNETAAYLATS